LENCQAIKQEHSPIPSLHHEGTNTVSDVDKANLSNEFFSTCFNDSTAPLGDPQPFDCGSGLDMFLCSVEDVISLIFKLDISKATGPDGISARMLKLTVYLGGKSLLRQ